MILSVYLIRRFLAALVGVSCGVALLYFLINVERHVSIYGDLGMSPLTIIGLTALKTPESVYAMLPAIVASSSLYMTLRLSTTSEMAVIRTYGKSAIVALAVPTAAAFLLGMISFSAINPLVAMMAQQHEAIIDRYQKDDQTETRIFLEEDGLVWLRQVVDGQQTVIRSSSTSGGRTFSDVHVFMFDSEGIPTRRLHSEAAELVESMSDASPGCQHPGPGFLLANVRNWDRTQSLDAIGGAADRDADCLPTKLTPEEIRSSLDPPGSIPLWLLPAAIVRLEEAGFSSTVHRIYLQSELARPIALASMVLLGGCFTLRQTRFANLPLMVTVSIVAILAAVLLGNFALIMGESEEVPVWLAVWIPPLVAALVSMGALFYLEDG